MLNDGLSVENTPVLVEEKVSCKTQLVFSCQWGLVYAGCISSKGGKAPRQNKKGRLRLDTKLHLIVKL